MEANAQELRLGDAGSHRLSFFAAALGVIAISAAICNGASPNQDTTGPVWPTKEWQTSSPEEEGMDSKQLANVVDFGTKHGFESLLIVRHGKIVAEAGYAPYYHAGIANRVYSVTKSVIGTLMAIACKDGLLDGTNHRVLDFFDRSSIANIDERKKAITVQNLLDMTSGIDWTEHFAPPSSDMEMASSVDWVKFVLDRPMSSVPGEIFNYNSGNPHLLSAILTKLTGMNALEYAKTKLFGPLGITDVNWDDDAKGNSNGGWGLYLQPRDMAKIGYLYLRKGVWAGKQLLPPDWVNKVSHATVETHLKQGFRYSNLFWALPDKPVYMAVGRYGQVIMIFPDLDIVVVTTGHKEYPLNEFAESIYRSAKLDTSLPADPVGAKVLADKILEISTVRPH